MIDQIVELGYSEFMDDQAEVGGPRVITPDNPPTAGYQYTAALEQTTTRRGFLGRVLAPLAVVGLAVGIGTHKSEPAAASTQTTETPQPTPTLTNPSSGLEQNPVSAIAATKTESGQPLSADPARLNQALEAARTTQYQNGVEFHAEDERIKNEIAKAGPSPAQWNEGNSQVPKPQS